MKRKQLLIIGGVVALAAGAFFLLRKPKAPEVSTTPPPTPPPAPPILPPGTTPTPPAPPAPTPAVLTIGDRVAMKTTARALNKDTFATYDKGGSDGAGNIEKDLFAGTIVGFRTGASGANYAILEGYAYAPKTDAGLVNRYMFNTIVLKKLA